MKKKLFASAIILSLIPFTNLYSQDFVKSNTSVRDILEGHQTVPADTYYLIAMAAAKKNNINEAYKAIETGLNLNSTNTKLLNLKAALLARQGNLIQARKIFMLVLNLEPNNEYAKQSLSAVEHLIQPVRHNVDQVIQKPVQSNTSEAPASPITPKSEISEIKQEEKLLEAEYFIDVKSKQECYHNMSLIKRAVDSKKNKDTKVKDVDLTPEKLVNEHLLVSIPVCPKSGLYEYKNNDVICKFHGPLTALGVEVTNIYSEFNKGMRAKQGRNYLDALKSFEQVVILYPRWGEAHFQLGDTLFRLGETDASISEIRESIKYDPKNIDAELLLANLYFKKGMKTAALNILDKVSASHKGSIYSYSARSIAKSIRSGRSYYEIFPPQ